MTGPKGKPTEIEIRQCIDWASEFAEIASLGIRVQYDRGELLLTDGYLETLTPIPGEHQTVLEVLNQMAHAFAMDARERMHTYELRNPDDFGWEQESLSYRILLDLICKVALGSQHHFDPQNRLDRSIAADLAEELGSAWAEELRRTAT